MLIVLAVIMMLAHCICTTVTSFQTTPSTIRKWSVVVCGLILNILLGGTDEHWFNNMGFIMHVLLYKIAADAKC